MIKLAFKTKKIRKEILDQALEFFQGNTDLEITEHSTCCFVMGEMYSDYIMVSLSQEEGGIEVNVESREYEYLVKKFVEKFR